jgi:hypothetical protein
MKIIFRQIRPEVGTQVHPRPLLTISFSKAVVFARLPEESDSITLPVTTVNQTVWNLGASEPRTTLYMGGLRLTPGLDYVIQLPLLTLLRPPSPGLVPGEQLILV